MCERVERGDRNRWIDSYCQGQDWIGGSEGKRVRMPKVPGLIARAAV